MVSSANARGVMQVMPGTWDYVQQNLAARAARTRTRRRDNVTAGVLYLKSLLNQTGGDESRRSPPTTRASARCARAASSTTPRKYVANVQALRGRFGG